MRLKLTVKRHRLPSIDLLWAITDDKSKKASTVAALLEDVNAVIPLETEDWGLDDYVVELGDFEALHFQNIAAIFSNDDHVTIRPLSTVDRRVRYLTGRDQINAAGQHLLDGLPFGKPDLRKPDRPPVNIPPPKNPLPLDPGPALLEGRRREEYSSHDNEQPLSRLRPPKKRRRLMPRPDKCVHFDNDQGLPGNEANNEQALVALLSDADTEEEFQPGETAREESDSDSTSDNESITSHSDVDDDQVAPQATSPLSADSSSDGSDSDSESSSDESSNDESDSNAPTKQDQPSSSSTSSSDEISSDSEPEQASSKPKANPFQLKADTLGARAIGGSKNYGYSRNSKRTVNDGSEFVPDSLRESNSGHGIHAPPGGGMQKTQTRNRRRRDQKLLRRLQGDGVLPPTATLATLREFQSYTDVSFRPTVDQDSVPLAEDAIEWEAARNAEDGNYADVDANAIADLERNAAQSENEVDNEASANSGKGQNVQLERLRRKLLGDLESMDVDQSQPASSTTTSTVADATPGKPAGLKSRRARIDIASTRRHLFSALGVRAPRDKEEEDKLRESYKQASAPRKVKEPQPEPEVEEDEQDTPDPTSDSYKAKLEVTAFECTNPDNVEQISAPPYPFEQRWDPALLKYCDDDRVDRAEGPRGKKRKRKNKRQSETYGDEAAENEVSLNYDEEQGDGAAESQLLQEEHDANETEDLPLPPADLTTLKGLEKDDVVPGTVIVYQRMEFSAETGWTPSLVQRTAEVIDGDDFGVRLLLAKRDRAQKEVQYDWKGKRLYEKFEMEHDDEEDPNVVECPLMELIDPKVVRAAPHTSSADATEGISVDNVKEASQDEVLDEGSATGGRSKGIEANGDE
ncbi:uncharacterized protein IWZ02DRAFT_457125 [Phyllosticta citriasiana]|uniref:DUF7357 domain-containing protein n=1 Tax=Phyllosticta citriasiana TaxID=595635 RepID=A0ABR1KA84_9PEZI